MTPPDETTLDAERRSRQLAFVAGGDNLEVGSTAGLPWPVEALAATRGDEPHVVQCVDAGLTAFVYRLSGLGRHWTLKRARPQALVLNVDGQTSFLNEVQRRADLERLKRESGGARRWQAVVDTCYASFRDGIILSPWIEGETVREWDERRLTQVLDLACALWTAGLFEWDLCPGNILDDGRRLRLFDFGYMYRFDPRRQFNTAGHGIDVPLFHPAERFETRNFSAFLLDLAAGEGEDAAFAAFRLEKAIALERYRRMRAEIAARGAEAVVLHWIDGITRRWADALAHDGEALYRAEGWRSHMLDLDDDLRGQTCTPLSLRRVDWLLEAVRRHHGVLRAQDAFLWDDTDKTRDELIAAYEEKRALAHRFQLAAPPAA